MSAVLVVTSWCFDSMILDGPSLCRSITDRWGSGALDGSSFCRCRQCVLVVTIWERILTLKMLRIRSLKSNVWTAYERRWRCDFEDYEIQRL